MNIDFAITNTDISEVEARNILKEAIDLKCLNSITCHYHLIKTAKNLINDSGKDIELSCFIDYPLGVSDSKTRCVAVEQAIKIGTNSVDISMPQNLATNRKYEKIREDIKAINDTLGNQPQKIKYVLEYRVFDHHCLKKLCEIFEQFNIRHVYPSSGYFIDNLADNILASIFLHQNSKELKVICTGNMWTDKHFETIKKSGLFGFRTNSLHSLKNFIQFNNCHK